jgi:predicted CXXCH cytochrome family protein
LNGVCLKPGALAILVILATVGLCSSAVWAENKDCRDCHEDFVGRLDDLFDHEPFAEKRCMDCHQFHSFEPRAEIKGQVVDVCAACHAEIVAFPSNLMHGALSLDDSCIECHDPHSAPNAKLLHEPVPQLCFGCHDGPEEGVESTHVPFANGECGMCHDPHGAYFGNLFPLPGAYNCQACHEGIVPEAGPESMHTADETRSCENCHTGHQSRYRSLLVSSTIDVCLECHDDPRADPDAPWHGAVEGRGCAGCHPPHFELDQLQLPESGPDFCAGCHAGIIARLDSPTPHDVAEECSACHSAHERIRIEDVGLLCADCHDVADHPQLAVSPAGACTTCHDPHGTEAPSLIASIQHPPFEEGDCETCHDPQDADMLVSNDLCLVCHDEPEPSGEHRVLQASGSALCIDCHSPHASGREFLLRGISRHGD